MSSWDFVPGMAVENADNKRRAIILPHPPMDLGFHGVGWEDQLPIWYIDEPFQPSWANWQKLTRVKGESPNISEGCNGCVFLSSLQNERFQRCRRFEREETWSFLLKEVALAEGEKCPKKPFPQCQSE